MDKQKSSSQDSYEDIVSRAMNEEEESVAPDSVHSESNWRSSWILSSTVGKVLILLLIINMGFWSLNTTAPTNVQTTEEADLELKAKYGAEDADLFTAMDQLGSGDDRSSRQLRDTVGRINQSFEKLDDDSEPVFKEEHFYFFGDTIVYTETRPDE